MTTTAITSPPSSPASSTDSASIDEELLALVELTEQASRHITHEGKGHGPIPLGWVTQDLFERLTYGEFSPGWRLSWGLDATMDVALREEEKEEGGLEVVGQLLFWGDPTRVHASTTAWLDSKVSAQLHDYEIEGARSTTTSIARVKMNLESEQEVDLFKEADESYMDPSMEIFTTLEVAWGNESVTHLLAVVNKWAQSDRNAIGVKVWRSSSSDAGASILVLTQARKLTKVHVWRYGSEAQEAVLPNHSGHSVAIVERPGPAAVVPGEWFCLTATTATGEDVPPPPVVWSLSELALEVESWYRAGPIMRVGRGSGAQRITREERISHAQRRVACAQAEVDDIRSAEGIAEELRVRLLEERERRLAFYRRRVGSEAEREQAG